jgi:hypothetical protein
MTRDVTLEDAPNLNDVLVPADDPPDEATALSTDDDPHREPGRPGR